MKKFYFLTLVTFANFSLAVDKEEIENQITEFRGKFNAPTKTEYDQDFLESFNILLNNIDEFIINSKSDFLPSSFVSLKNDSLKKVEILEKANKKANDLKIDKIGLWDMIDLDEFNKNLSDFLINIKNIKKTINDKTIVSPEKRRARDIVNKLIDSGLMFMVTQLQRAIEDTKKNRGENFVNNYIKPFQEAFTDKKFRDKQNAFKPDLIKEIRTKWDNIIKALKIYLKDYKVDNKINDLNDIANKIINLLNNAVLTGWSSLDINKILNEFKNIKDKELDLYLKKHSLLEQVPQKSKPYSPGASATLEQFILYRLITALDNILVLNIYLNKDINKIKSNPQTQQNPLIMITNKSRGFIEALKNLDLKKASENSLKNLQSEQNEAFAILSIALQADPQVYPHINKIKELTGQILNQIYAAYKYKSSDKTRSFFYNIASEIKNYISQISPLKQQINNYRTNLQDDAEIKFYKYFDSWIGDLIVYTNSIAKQIEEIKNS